MNYRSGDAGIGFANKGVKLTEAQVLQIYSHPKNDTLTAADFGVNQSTITAIRAGRTWKYLYRIAVLNEPIQVIHGKRGKRPFDSRYIPEPNSGCWLWVGATDSDGYGVTAGGMKAHRESFARHRYSPGTKWVLHKCDTPSCINPDHLYCGTVVENSADRNNRGRTAKGSRQRAAKLTDDLVRKIRNDNRPTSVIAKECGVTPRVIHLVKNRMAWRHVA